jgi:hypothetical protein
MNRQSDLFDLIRSMTKSEKRYFKLSASPQKGEKNYLRLFDAIERQKSYDEEAIKRAFAGEAFVRQLHVAKNYLHKLILRSLRAYRAESSVDGQIQTLLQDARIFFEKGLARQCAGALKRARALAEEYERDYALLEIIDMEDRLLPDSNATGEALEASHTEWRALLRRIENAGEMDYLANRVTLVMMYRGLPRDHEEAEMIEEVVRHPLLADERSPLSTRAHRRFNYIHSTFHYARNDAAKAIAYTERNVRLAEHRFEPSSEYGNNYVASLINLALLLSDNGEEERFHDALRRMRGLPEKLAERGCSDERLLYRIFNASTGIELLHYNAHGDFASALAMAPLIEEGCRRFRRYISTVDEIRFDYMMAWSLFGSGEHHRALDRLNNVLEHSDMQARQHVLHAAKILNLIIHYELGNIQHLEYLVKSTYRFLGRRNTLFRFESVLLRHFRKLPALKKDRELIAWFAGLKGELEPLMASRFEKQAFDYFNYLPWLASKIEGGSFAEMVKRSARPEEASPPGRPRRAHSSYHRHDPGGITGSPPSSWPGSSRRS